MGTTLPADAASSAISGAEAAQQNDAPHEIPAAAADREATIKRHDDHNATEQISPATKMTLGMESPAEAVFPAAPTAPGSSVTAASYDGIVAPGPTPSPISGIDGSKDEARISKKTVEGECEIGDRCQSSAERNLWSIFNPIWRVFVVNKARLPTSADLGADWAGTAGRLDEINMFLGRNNPVNRETVGFLRRCVEDRLVMEGILLRGPAGSGKSALMKAFLSGFLKRFASNPEAFARLYKARVLNVTREHLDGPPQKLASRVKRFFAAKNDRLSDIVPRFVVVDGLESVSSKSQLALLALIEAAITSGALSSQEGGVSSGGGSGRGASAGLRMMMTTRDASKIAAPLRKCVKPLKVEMVEENDGVRIFLRILQRENVGYELLAVKAIFRTHWPDLQRCITVANKVFCEKEFLSVENTLKVIAPKTLAAREEMSRHVQASGALEPLAPCPACTLRPPCQHISEQELASRGLRRRNELPQRKIPGAVASAGRRGGGGGDEGRGFVDCEGFVRTGACRAFNERGRCSNHHPLDAHMVEIPRPRCPQCTIRLPCGHCDYDRSRRGLKTFCEAAKARLEKCEARLRRLLNESRTAKRTATAMAEAGEESSRHDGLRRGSRQRASDSTNSADIAAPAALSAPAAPFSSTAENLSSKSEQPKTAAITGHNNEVSERGTEAVLAKLGALSSDLNKERAWTTDSTRPEGGMHEFRADVFQKKLAMWSKRCEEAHQEADAVSEAYLFLLDDGAQ